MLAISLVILFAVCSISSVRDILLDYLPLQANYFSSWIWCVILLVAGALLF